MKISTSVPSPLPLNQGGTASSDRQTALDTLADASSGTNEYVLTKDTSTGHIQLKVSSGGYITESGSLDYFSTVANKVAIGSTSLIDTEKFLVKGLADVIQTIIRAHSTQTANIIEIRKSDDTVLFSVTNASGVVVGGNTSTLIANGANSNLDLSPNGTGNVTVSDGTNTTKIMSFELSGATASKTATIVSSHTNDRTITLPDATDTLIGKATTDTLTNKRITRRVITVTDSATPTINTDNTDVASMTGVTNNITSFTTNLSGTPVPGDRLIVEITGTATRTIAWGNSFENSGNVPLPSGTSSTTKLTTGLIWNPATTKWTCVAVA